MPDDQQNDERRVSWVEWVLFSTGLILVLGTLGTLVYEAVRYEEKPPDLSIVLEQPTRQGTSYVVSVTVENRGTQTAAAVEVEVTAHFPREPSVASATFQFAPRLSDTRGWVSFDKDPRAADSVTARVLGYEEP